MKAILILCAMPPAIIFPCQWIGTLITSPVVAMIVGFVVITIVVGFVMSLLYRTPLPFFSRSFAYFRTHQAKDGRWTAYAALTPIEDEDILDPMVKLITAHAADEDDAIEHVMTALEEVHGTRAWFRSRQTYPLFSPTDSTTLL